MKTFLILMTLAMLVGCATPKVATCPSAPKDTIAHCQNMSGQISSQSTGSATVLYGIALGTRGATSTRQVNQFEFMRCMKQMGYDCQIEEMVVRSAGETTPKYISQPVPSTGVSTTSQEGIPSNVSKPQEVVKATIQGSYVRDEDIDKVKPGMTEMEVIALFGSHPSRREKVRGNYTLTWIYYMGPGSRIISLLFDSDNKLIKVTSR